MNRLDRALALRLIAGLSLSASFGHAQIRCPGVSSANPLTDRFAIRGASIKMPLGAFLLVRKNGDIGAIRLISIDPAATEYLGKSTYESFFSADGSGLFVSGNPKVIRQSGDLEIKPEGGLIRGFAYQPGLHKARIGGWSFSFDYPSVMDMSGYHHNGDQGYEFAPTSACELSQIDANEKHLRWFRYNPNASVVLPLADLAK